MSGPLRRILTMRKKRIKRTRFISHSCACIYRKNLFRNRCELSANKVPAPDRPQAYCALSSHPMRNKFGLHLLPSEGVVNLVRLFRFFRKAGTLATPVQHAPCEGFGLVYRAGSARKKTAPRPWYLAARPGSGPKGATLPNCTRSEDRDNLERPTAPAGWQGPCSHVIGSDVFTRDSQLEDLR
jgi:hypothetical protein